MSDLPTVSAYSAPYQRQNGPQRYGPRRQNWSRHRTRLVRRGPCNSGDTHADIGFFQHSQSVLFRRLVHAFRVSTFLCRSRRLTLRSLTRRTKRTPLPQIPRRNRRLRSQEWHLQDQGRRAQGLVRLDPRPSRLSTVARPRRPAALGQGRSRQGQDHAALRHH